MDSLAILPEDPAAAAEEIQRRREEIGFSYFVFGAGSADALAPVVAELAGRQAQRAEPRVKATWPWPQVHGPRCCYRRLALAARRRTSARSRAL